MSILQIFVPQYMSLHTVTVILRYEKYFFIQTNNHTIDVYK